MTTHKPIFRGMHVASAKADGRANDGQNHRRTDDGQSAPYVAFASLARQKCTSIRTHAIKSKRYKKVEGPIDVWQAINFLCRL